MKAKNWNKVSEILPNITSPKIYIQYAKNREAEGTYYSVSSFTSHLVLYIQMIRIKIIY